MFFVLLLLKTTSSLISCLLIHYLFSAAIGTITVVCVCLEFVETFDLRCRLGLTGIAAALCNIVTS